MKLVLSKASEEDLEEIVRQQFKSFESYEPHDGLVGPNNPHGWKLAKGRFLKDMKEDPADHWMKVVDIDTGKIIAASHWKIYPTVEDTQKSGGLGSEVDWYEDGTVEKKSAEELLDAFNQKRKHWTSGHAHVVLNSLFTDPDFQRCGAGSIMMEWGCNQADKLGIPMWIESSEAGHRLYSKFGFKDVEKVVNPTSKWTQMYYMMRRDVKPLEN